MPEREKLVVDIGAEALSPSLNTLCPKVLMFPSIKRHATTSLSRLNRREMFTRLASQSPGLLAKDAYGQGQAELLAEIVKTTEAFDLQLGDDVFNDPQGLSQRLQAI